jgi:hypothetical protein
VKLNRGFPWQRWHSRRRRRKRKRGRRRRKETLFTSKIVVKFKKRIMKCFIWIIAVYGAGEEQLDRLCEK